MYAILAVELFRDVGGNPAGEVNMTFGNGEAVDMLTDRGQPFGEEHFGTFLQALFTMFQAMTGDGWSDVARPLILGW